MIVTLTNSSAAQVYVSLLRRSLSPGQSEQLQPITAPQLEQEIQLLELVEAGTIAMSIAPESTDATVDELSTVGDVSPGRVLLVAKSWPVGVDPAVYFTTIQSALDKAATLSPDGSNPICIEIGPGTYTEDLTLVSDVNLIGYPGLFMTRIDGNITWTPGAGVNAAKTNAAQNVNLSNLYSINAAKTLTWTTTGQTTQNVQLICTECVFNNISATGPHATSGSDNFFAYNNNWLSGTYSFASINGVTPGVEIVGTKFRGFTASGTTVARVEGGQTISNAGGTLTVSGTAQVFLQGINLINPIVVSSTATIGLTANGCKLLNTCTVNAGATADIRSTNYTQKSNLVSVGGGTINRTVWNDTTSSTSVGSNAITYSIPYPSGETSYNVKLQLVSGPGNAAATVTSKTATGFTLTDSVGGNVWDYTVFQEG